MFTFITNKLLVKQRYLALQAMFTLSGMVFGADTKSHLVQCKFLSDMWPSTLEISAAHLRSVTEIAPKSPFLCVNRSPVGYGFRADAQAIGILWT